MPFPVYMLKTEDHSLLFNPLSRFLWSPSMKELEVCCYLIRSRGLSTLSAVYYMMKPGFVAPGFTDREIWAQGSFTPRTSRNPEPRT